MPIYEFYCPDCHTVFSFFSAAVDTAASPACPRCQRPRLGRKPSSFAMLRKTAERGGEEPGELPDLDDEKMAGAMEAALAGMPEGAEEDPRQMARLLRQFGAAAGMELGPRMEEMVARLEAGEDPEALESELDDGEADDGEGSLADFFQARRASRARRTKPRVDRELYFL